MRRSSTMAPAGLLNNPRRLAIFFDVIRPRIPHCPSESRGAVMVIDEKAIFVAALALADAQDRESYLQEACAGRPELLARLRTLLSAHEESQGPLDRGPAAPSVTRDPAQPEAPGTI